MAWHPLMMMQTDLWREKTMRTFVAVTILALPAAAQADCVSVADLAEGVRFHMGEGIYWELQGQGQDREAQFQWSPDYPIQVMDFARGVFMVSLQTPEMDAPWQAEFAPGVENSPAPAPGVDWHTRMTTVGGGQRRMDDLHYEWGAAQRLSLGDCGYDVVPLALHSVPVGGELAGTTSGYLYFAEFGGVVITHDGFGTRWTLSGITAR
ncbi:hypothetical protein Jann_1753 [Jannaschia sp. CCS1]|nr:hypothetical protein Jann_1753 [Jannaschia sp. CCS1]